MPAPPISRREFAAGFAMSSSLLAAEAVAQPSGSKRSLHVVCVGAHPDDPESGCGGTLARYAAAGHRVTIVYLTRGEAGIPGKTHVEAAAIRTAEAEAACRILGAKPVFAGQIDGATEVTPERTRAFTAMLLDDRPDVVLTHWPIDTHPDHQAASLLALARARRPAGGSRSTSSRSITAIRRWGSNRRITSISRRCGRRRRRPCLPTAARMVRRSIGNITRSWRVSGVASRALRRPKRSSRSLGTTGNAGCPDSSHRAQPDESGREKTFHRFSV